MHPLDPILDLDASQLSDFERNRFRPFEQRWDGDGPVPQLSLNSFVKVPDLKEIHPRRWAAVLGPLNRKRRGDAVLRTGLTVREFEAATALLKWLDDPPDEIAGTTPTTLARWFLLSGSRRVVADNGATYAAARERR